MKAFTFLLAITFYFSTITSLKCQTNLWKIDTEHGSGFIDKNGKIVIKPVYDQVSKNFSDGLAWFTKNGKDGYIDTCGNIAFFLKDTWFNFNEGLAPYFSNHKLCFINKSGKIAFFPKYLNYYIGCELPHAGKPSFSEGLAAVVIQEKPNVDVSGYIFINKKGKNEFNTIFIYADNFSEGLAFVECKNHETGYIDKNSKFIIKLKNEQAGNKFSEGFAAVYDANNKSFYIDKKGKRICESVFGIADPFSEGMARIRGESITDNYGYIDTRGTIAIEPIYCNASDFLDGVAFVGTSNTENGKNKYRTYIINKTGRILFGPFEDISMHYRINDLAYCTKYMQNQTTIGIYLNKEGEIVWSNDIAH